MFFDSAFGVCLSAASSPHDTSSSRDHDGYGNNENYLNNYVDSSSSHVDASSSAWDSTGWQNTSISYT